MQFGGPVKKKADDSHRSWSHSPVQPIHGWHWPDGQEHFELPYHDTHQEVVVVSLQLPSLIICGKCLVPTSTHEDRQTGLALFHTADCTDVSAKLFPEMPDGSPIATACHATVVPDEVSTSAGHYPVSTKQNRCRVCQRNTKRGCGKCGINLHDCCFMVFHRLSVQTSLLRPMYITVLVLAKKPDLIC